MFKSKGTVVYDPKGRTSFRPNWVILSCCEGIREYYSWLIRREKFIKLQEPAWRGHISIVRGEVPKDTSAWGNRQGDKVEFKYSGQVETNGQRWWIPVESEEILDIRESLGLPRKPLYPLHMTIGFVMPWDFDPMIELKENTISNAANNRKK